MHVYMNVEFYSAQGLDGITATLQFLETLESSARINKPKMPSNEDFTACNATRGDITTTPRYVGLDDLPGLFQPYSGIWSSQRIDLVQHWTQDWSIRTLNLQLWGFYEEFSLCFCCPQDPEQKSRKMDLLKGKQVWKKEGTNLKYRCGKRREQPR